MTTKTIPFRQPAVLGKPAEDWVQPNQMTAKALQPIVPTKRLTVDIPEDLHRRIKVDCAGKGSQISDIVRDLLTKEFPAA